MKKALETKKEKNLNNIKSIKPNDNQIEKKDINQDQKKDNTKTSNIKSKEEELEEKSKLLNKPKKLLAFDAVAHFKNLIIV